MIDSVGRWLRPGGAGPWMSARDTDRAWVVPEIDASRPHPARIYNYWLGGKDHFGPDRAAAEAVTRVAPYVPDAARGKRAFLTRAVTHLAQAGIDQFLDIGVGLPAAENVHEIAQRVNPASRIVYVDNDPIVLCHARAILAVDERTIAVRGDVRDPDAILTAPAVQAHLDFTRPIAVLLTAVLHFVQDEEDPAGIVAAIRDGLPPGSYLAVSHATDRFTGPQAARRRADAVAAAELYTALAAPFVLRGPERVRGLLHGWDLVAPGLVPAHRWRPDGRPGPPIPVLAAVARRSRATPRADAEQDAESAAEAGGIR